MDKLAPVKPGMTDQTSTNIARDGAPKRIQTSFAIKPGMKNLVTDDAQLKGVHMDSVGFGGAPDASNPNPMDPSPRDKLFGGKSAKLAWGMKDAMGDSVNGDTLTVAAKTVLGGGRM